MGLQKVLPDHLLGADLSASAPASSWYGESCHSLASVRRCRELEDAGRSTASMTDPRCCGTAARQDPSSRIPLEIDRSRFFVKAVGCQTRVSIDRPTNYRSRRLSSSCSMLKDQGSDQTLRRNRSATGLRIDSVDGLVQAARDGVRKRVDRPGRAMHRNPLLLRNVAEHAILAVVVSANRVLHGVIRPKNPAA